MFLQLTMLDIQMGRTVCAICTTGLIDPQTGHELAAFRRELVDVLASKCTVWTFVTTGASWDSIRLANQHCRNVCLRCHSAISIAKRCIGIQRLKALQISDCIKQMAARKVESLVYMLVFQRDEPS